MAASLRLRLTLAALGCAGLAGFVNCSAASDSDVAADTDSDAEAAGGAADFAAAEDVDRANVATSRAPDSDAGTLLARTPNYRPIPPQIPRPVPHLPLPEPPCTQCPPGALRAAGPAAGR